MIFENVKRVKFKKCPLKSVICQLRFPAILSINSEYPVKFQEKIREKFPVFNELQESQNQIIIGREDDSSAIPKFIQNKSKNYRFATQDNIFAINLTTTFISFSTTQYTTWDDFKRVFKQALQVFIEIYSPAFFSRIGLRYIDAFNYKTYNLADNTLVQYFNPAVLGGFSDGKLSSCIRSLQHLIELNIGENYFAKILAAKAQVLGESGESFVLDSDFISNEQTSITDYEHVLDFLHDNASGFIDWATSEEMKNIMEPEEL